MKKITKATFKSFVKRNRENLQIKVKSSFDNQVDCLVETGRGFSPAKSTEIRIDYTFGIKGVWIVGSGRDFFKKYEDKDFRGIEVSNCCRNFVVAIRKCACGTFNKFSSYICRKDGLAECLYCGNIFKKKKVNINGKHDVVLVRLKNE